MSLFAVVYDKNINSVFTVVRSKLPLHIKNRQIAKSNILQFYLAPKIAQLNTRKIWLMIFAWNLLLTKLSENKLLIFFIVFLASLQHFIKGSFNQVNVVCHTYYCKKIEELFTLFSELPFLADLVFWLYYIVLQVAMLFLFTKIPNYVTQCSPSLREKHIDKNWVNMLQLFKG